MAGLDAFSGGILPGGLRSQNDIRILICYLLQSVGVPLSEENLTKIVNESGLANYFEVRDAISSLMRHEHIQKTGGGDLEIRESGLEIAKQLDITLPLSVRDHALRAAVLLLASAKRQKENRVEIEETPAGYQVHCHISGGRMDLMTISVYIPDRKQAYFVKENFHRDPGKIYELLLSALTDNENIVD